MSQKTNCIIFLILLSLSLSCEIINPDEAIPSYIYINNVDVKTNFNAEGTNSHKITDAWVYIDDKLIGVYELPFTMPILASGNQTIEIRAGIKINGISATRTAYYFYDSYSSNVQLQEQITDTIFPQIQYVDYTTFEWVEDFEDPGITVETTSNGKVDSLVKVNNDSVFDGGTSALAIYMDDTYDTFEIISQEHDLPDNGRPVYFELNYKNNNDFKVGIWINEPGISTKKTLLYIRQSDNWNKIYIDLSGAVKGQAANANYQIYLSGVKSSSISKAEIYLDNFKLIHN